MNNRFLFLVSCVISNGSLPTQLYCDQQALESFELPPVSQIIALNPTNSTSHEAIPKDGLPSSSFRYFVNSSFTYWYAKEEGLNIAESALLLPSGVTVASPTGVVLKQTFDYQPGFKLGIGTEYLDLWNLEAEYTYFRSSTVTYKAAPENTSEITATGVWNMNDWFLQVSPLSYQSLTGTYLSSRWKLSMDLGDLVASFRLKPQKGLIISPLAGIRTVWLRQQMNLGLTQSADSIGSSSLLPAQPLKSYNSSHGWGIGPRLGVKGKYNLPAGIYLNSLLATSLLYTQYTSIKHFEQKASKDFNFGVKTHMYNYGCIRPILDLNLGMGWGMKICNKYNIDLSASYDFSYFWNQNMMRTMLDEFFNGSASGSLDLYFQGLTITSCFKF